MGVKQEDYINHGAINTIIMAVKNLNVNGVNLTMSKMKGFYY